MINLPKTRSELRKFIIKHNLLPYQCQCGNIGEWQNKPLKLQLDHIDGNKNNNVLINLRFLCPNCHTQTETFCKGHIKQKSIVYTELISKTLNVIDNCKSYREILLKLNLPDGKHYYQKLYRIFQALKDNPKVIVFKQKNKLKRHEPKFNLRKVINRPSKEELQKLVWSKPSTQIAKEFGLQSSNSILKWCQTYGISKPPPGYWNKLKAGKISPTGL